MKIFVTGMRGIPDIPGGIEKHCQELYPLIASKGYKVTVAVRKPYAKYLMPNWQGVDLSYIYTPRKKSIEAIFHTALAILLARLNGFRLIHIHAAGPGLLVPLARLIGMKVVFTSHGPDYNRLKWGKFAKWMLQLGEYLGGRFANQVIAISKMTEEIIKERCHRCANLIYNGVTLPKNSHHLEYLSRYGLAPGKYVISVARFVPEKGLHDLVDAFKRIKTTDCKLVIAGDADHETTYSRALKKSAVQDERIILTGYIVGEQLHQLYSNAALFVLPSCHEGLPIALLEAMSYGLNVLVSDIPANVDVGLANRHYFKCGDAADLQTKLSDCLNMGLTETEKQKLLNIVKCRHCWVDISEQTIEVYRKTMNGHMYA